MRAWHWFLLIMSAVAMLVIADAYMGWSDKELQAMELEAKEHREAKIKARICAKRPVLCD